MAIRHSVDDVRRTLLISISGNVTGREFSAFSGELYGGRPDLFDYDCVLDLLEYDGDISYSDVKRLQQMYAQRGGGDARPRLGFIVTSDRNFHVWAAALDAQFPGRTHLVATTLEEAFLRLEEGRTRGRKPGLGLIVPSTAAQ